MKKRPTLYDIATPGIVRRPQSFTDAAEAERRAQDHARRTGSVCVVYAVNPDGTVNVLKVVRPPQGEPPAAAPFADLAAALLALGYREGAPPTMTRACAAIDRDACRNAECSHCGRGG